MDAEGDIFNIDTDEVTSLDHAGTQLRLASLPILSAKWVLSNEWMLINETFLFESFKLLLSFVTLAQ